MVSNNLYKCEICAILNSFFSLECTLTVAGVPKHMKRFESLLRFESTEISCLLINILYIEIILCHIPT